MSTDFPAVVDGKVGGTEVATVVGSDLHRSLKVGRDFTTWIKARIEKYGFVRGSDYEVFPGMGVNPQGGRPRDEYVTTLDMAKELAMVENNDQGRDVRRYFIECERRAKAATADAIPQSFPEALRLAADQAEQISVLQPKADALDRISAADGESNITNTAKALQVRPVELFRLLEEKRWIFRRPNSKKPIAYQRHIQAGRLTHRIATFERPDGSEGASPTVMVTPKGLAELAVLLRPPDAPS